MSTVDMRPVVAVWEITYACNMCCKHCGSSCGKPLPNELTLDRSLQLCDELAELGVKNITLSGGEPLMRPDWHQIATRLTQNGICTNFITNGWLITPAVIEQASKAGIANICLSLDGMQVTHDFIRKPGSFAAVLSAFKLLKKYQMPSAAITSINRKNLSELPLIKKLLYQHQVQRWQIQLAMPMGNLSKHPRLIIRPRDVETIIDFCYQTMLENKIIIHIGDNLGYHTEKYQKLINHDCTASCSQVLFKESDPKQNKVSYHWLGCPAGQKNFGIRADGAICSCLAIRHKKFIAGNVQQKPLKAIWNDAAAFTQNRFLVKEGLRGFCRTCQHGSVCRGGCTAQKLTFGGSIYAENKNCLYKLAIDKTRQQAKKIKNTDQLIIEAKQQIAQKNYQVAKVYIDQALRFSRYSLYLLDLAGFVNYFLENYQDALRFNEQALKIDPQHAYALRGKGMCLYKLGHGRRGIVFLKKALKFADPTTAQDINHDLKVMVSRP